jgi:hypothetical protein
MSVANIQALIHRQSDLSNQLHNARSLEAALISNPQIPTRLASPHCMGCLTFDSEFSLALCRAEIESISAELTGINAKIEAINTLLAN